MDDREIRWRAVEVAYRDHADDVYRVALAILRDPETAVDITHDTFARAFDRWEQYDSARPLRAWLHGIVSHAALDALRRRRVRAHALQTSRPDPRDRRRPAASRATRRVHVAEIDAIDGALADLKPDARAALVLRHYYGYDYAEIARFLRTSPGNVGSVLSRAHATLRVRLAADSTRPTDRPARATPRDPMTEVTPMTREPDRPADSPATLDDDQLAALVRAGVEDWRLPPQRLDQPTWRDRVGARGTGRRRGWFARLGRSGRGGRAGHGPRRVRRGLADVAALERSDRRRVADATGGVADVGRTPRRAASPSPDPAASGLPVLQLNGALPDPSRVMVRSDATYRLVDLSTGTLGTGVRRHVRRPADDAGPSVRWLGVHLHGLDARPAAEAGSS